MQPKTHYFQLYRGDTHLFKVSLNADKQPLDLSQTQFVMDIKAADGSVVSPTISVDGSDVWLLFPAALTADISWSRAEYDLRAVTGNVVKTYLRGAVTVSPSISRVQLGDADGPIHEQTVSVDVSGQAVIMQHSGGTTADNQVIADLTVKLARLESAVADAEESAEIAALSEQLAVAQAAIEQAGSLEGRLKTLETEREALSAQARELAQQRASLESALTRLTAGDKAVQALTEQLSTLRGQVEAAEESAEIEALHRQIAGLIQDVEAAKTAAAEAEESAEIAALQAKISELETLAAKQAEQSAEIAKLREMMGLPKREKIHLTQSMWSDGGYTWLKANFANTYKDPKVYLTVEHNALSTSFLTWNFGVKTDASVLIRSNFNKAQIDVGYSVYLYVEDWG